MRLHRYKHEAQASELDTLNPAMFTRLRFLMLRVWLKAMVIVAGALPCRYPQSSLTIGLMPVEA